MVRIGKQSKNDGIIVKHFEGGYEVSIHRVGRKSAVYSVTRTSMQRAYDAVICATGYDPALLPLSRAVHIDTRDV